MHSDHELLEDFVVVVFDPSKTGSLLFFRGKIGGPSRFYQLPDTVVKLVPHVLLEDMFCGPLPCKVDYSSI